MRYGFEAPTTGEFADARVLAGLAADAEAAGWDGFFVWDVLLGEKPVLDVWIALTAITLATSRITLGIQVLPLARHRPWLAAQRLANLDHLSGGRMTCTVGLGHQERDFTAFGEAGDAATRARKLDEGLDIVAGLLSGKPVTKTGEHYHLTDAALTVNSLQTPRLPIWAVGRWPHRAPFRRAARCDGMVLMPFHAQRRGPLTPDDLRECVDLTLSLRQSSAPFDVVMAGESPFDPQVAHEQILPYAAAGATWWMEEGLGFELAEVREHIAAGPPRA